MREVLGYPGYLVTPSGVIWSVREGFPRKLITSMHKGYVHAQIKSAPGRHNQRKMPVHQVVLLAYRGERPSPSHVGRHLDGDVMNNHPDNLAWGTQAENIADCIAHGRHVSGRVNERVGPRKMLLEDVQRLRDAATLDEICSLAASFNVGEAHARAVAAGRSRKQGMPV